MGILNATTDSFYPPSRVNTNKDIADTAAEMEEQGADIIDIGAYSSRPGAKDIPQSVELEKIVNAVKTIRQTLPNTILSIDTFRASVAKAAIYAGADIINDISAGDCDPDMIATVAKLKVPYIMMHMRGTPATMSSLTQYPDGVTATVITELSKKVDKAHRAGINDIIIDPGLGFAKTVEQNWQLLHDTPLIAQTLNLPILIGLSRKSMLTKPLNITPEQSLPATIAANTLALSAGATIIRVHDVQAASQAVAVYQQFNR